MDVGARRRQAAASTKVALPKSTLRNKVASTLSTIVVLFKLRVVVLLLLASIGGWMLATSGKQATGGLVVLLLTGMLSAAGSSAINQYLEADIDAQMQRTRRRPLATGSLSRPELVPVIGIGLIALAILIALIVNLSLAIFLSLGALIYIWIYTVWLKPRTLLNIVIGGAAGSCAVLSGSAAAGNWNHPLAVSLALLVFTWTPLHFWSLAHAHRADYAGVQTPMLPVVVNQRTSAWWIALHTGVTALIALLMGADPVLGLPYLALTLIATLWLGWHAIYLLLVPTPSRAFTVFKVSNIYLGLVLTAIYIGVLF